MLDLEDIVVEISEDAGATYAPAYTAGVFVAPYNGVHSKVRRPDSHSITFWIDRVGFWPSDETMKVRLSCTDEFGNTASKEAPVIWG